MIHLSSKIKFNSYALIIGVLVLCTLSSFSEVRNGSKQMVKHLARLTSSDVSKLMLKYGLVPDTDVVTKEGLELLDKSVKHYIELKSFSMDVEYSVFYNTENFDVPNDKKTGKIIRHKDDFYQEEMGNIKVMNDKYELILNERAEFMTISNRIEKKIEPVSFQMDSLSRFITRAEKIENGFCFYLEEGAVEKFEVITDKNGYLKTWRSYYREKMDFGDGEVQVVTQLRYLNFNKKPKIDPAIFSIDPYVSIGKKGEVTAKGNYKNYYVLNQLQKL